MAAQQVTGSTDARVLRGTMRAKIASLLFLALLGGVFGQNDDEWCDFNGGGTSVRFPYSLYHIFPRSLAQWTITVLVFDISTYWCISTQEFSYFDRFALNAAVFAIRR